MIQDLLLVIGIFFGARLEGKWVALVTLLTGFMMESVASLPFGVITGSVAAGMFSMHLVRRKFTEDAPITRVITYIVGITTYSVSMVTFLLLWQKGDLATTLIFRGIAYGLVAIVTLALFSATFRAVNMFLHAFIFKKKPSPSWITRSRL